MSRADGGHWRGPFFTQPLGCERDSHWGRGCRQDTDYVGVSSLAGASRKTQAWAVGVQRRTAQASFTQEAALNSPSAHDALG